MYEALPDGYLPYIALACIALVANYLKGVIGTGTGTVMMATSTLIIDPKLAVVVISYISIFSSLAMIRLKSVQLADTYWVPIACAIAVGSVFGAMALKYVPSDVFKTVLGVVFFFAALWFGWKRHKVAQFPPPPTLPKGNDLAVACGSGFLGGFVGINASPLVMWFGSRLDKQHMRRLFVLIFTASTTVQTATYLINGMLTREAVYLSLFLAPAVLLGIYFGNRTFLRVPEVLFGRILAAFLVLAALRMIWQGVM